MQFILALGERDGGKLDLYDQDSSAYAVFGSPLSMLLPKAAGTVRYCQLQLRGGWWAHEVASLNEHLLMLYYLSSSPLYSTKHNHNLHQRISSTPADT